MVQSHPPTSSFASTKSSTHATAFHASSSSSPSWITKSRASDYITGLSSLFSSYSICYGRDKVRVANGTLSSIYGK